MMLQTRAASAYRKVYVQSARPAQVLDELYAALLDDCRRAAAAIAARDVHAKSEAVQRALRIVGELQAALDHARAPELCGRLAALYEFIGARLMRASLHLDAEPLAEAERVIGTLRDSFREAATRI